jgi:hypothetical protein
MAPTTYAAFVDGLEALTVSGVTRVFQGPPAALNTADLPAMWCQAPRGEEGAMTFLPGTGGWPSLVVDLLIATEPVGQSIQASNFALQVQLLDALATALRGADIGRAPLSWSIRAVQITVAGNAYWGVSATVTGRG